MPGINEIVGTTEQVIAIVRTEGVDMKPTEIRCKANIAEALLDENGNPQVDEDGVVIVPEEIRCENEITFDMASEGWSQFCEGHTNETNVARASGLPAPTKVSQELIDAQFAELQSEEATDEEE